MISEVTVFLTKWHTISAIRSAVLKRDVELLSWAIRSCHNVLAVNKAAITHQDLKYMVDVIPIDGPVNEEQAAEALRHLPEWFIGLYHRMRRAVVRLMELMDISALAQSDLDRDIPLIG
jgi:hypothetical protein